MIRRNVLILGPAAFSPRLDGIAPFAKAHGWNVLYNRLLDRPFSYACDGAIVLLTNDAREIDCVRRLIRRSIPVVDLTIFQAKLPLPRVVGDHCGIGRLAAEHFNLRGFAHAAWLSSNLSRPIGISQVAEEIGVSPATVKRLFASGLGCGVTEILSRLRLARVKALLADGDSKLTEIARQCGYCNASYMANSFKAAFDITPARWRKSACRR